MPHNPLQIMEARVERAELIEWNGKLARTLLVTYRQDAGSGITATRQPVCQLWVRRDGTVLKQHLSLANLRVEFVRNPDGGCEQMSAPPLSSPVLPSLSPGISAP
jgi:hypothetical protein